MKQSQALILESPLGVAICNKHCLRYYLESCHIKNFFVCIIMHEFKPHLHVFMLACTRQQDQVLNIAIYIHIISTKEISILNRNIMRSVIVILVSNHYGKILLLTLDLIVTVSKMLLHDFRSVMQIIQDRYEAEHIF